MRLDPAEHFVQHNLMMRTRFSVGDFGYGPGAFRSWRAGAGRGRGRGRGRDRGREARGVQDRDASAGRSSEEGHSPGWGLNPHLKTAASLISMGYNPSPGGLPAVLDPVEVRDASLGDFVATMEKAEAGDAVTPACPSDSACEWRASAAAEATCRPLGAQCDFPVRYPRASLYGWSKHYDNGASKEVLHAGFQFEDYLEQDDVRVVDDPAEMSEALVWLGASMRDCLLGFDVEWRAEFRKGQRNKVALLQIASFSRALLLRTSHAGLPDACRDFLCSPNVCLVGFDFRCDAKKLQESFGFDLHATRHIDLKVFGEALGYRQLGLSRLVRWVFRRELPKSKKVSMSNWEQPGPLSPAQIKYAATDAWICAHIFRQFRHWHHRGEKAWEGHGEVRCSDMRCRLRMGMPMPCESKRQAENRGSELVLCDEPILGCGRTRAVPGASKRW